MKIAVPLTDQLCTKRKNIRCKEDQQRSFDKIKGAIVAAPVLTIVDPNESFVLEIDPSNDAIGSVFLQRGCFVAFESKKLDKT